LYFESSTLSSLNTHYYYLRMKFSSSVILATLFAAASAAPMSGRAAPVYNIHPNGDTTKCIGILGGQYVEGAAIDMYVHHSPLGSGCD
jgi:hypothetical protein